MLLQLIDENQSFEGLVTTLFVMGGVGVGIVIALSLWMLFTRMRRRRAPR